MNIYVATANAHKLEEIEKVLSPLGLQALAHPDYGGLVPKETGTTFEENACLKACALSKLTDGYVIADDSGLAVAALNGEPGVYSARYAGENATDAQNNCLLLINIPPWEEDRSAKFICVIALAKEGEVEAYFTGECLGRIAEAPKGENGFGYDPLFVLPDERHIAELTGEEKNAISHRGDALRKLAEYLKAKNLKEKS